MIVDVTSLSSTLTAKLAKVPGLKSPTVVVNEEDGSVVIEGEVSCYYHKQLAGHAAIEMKCWRNIKNNVKVIEPNAT